MGVVAEFERNRIIERTKEGRHTRYSQGKWAAGQPLFGYAYDPVTHKLQIREDESKVVERIFNHYVFDRIGVEQIARKLNEDKVKPRQQAHQWHASAVRDIIRHPGYEGQHPLKINIPVIIEPALWELAQQRRKDNHRLYRRNGSPWLLQGIIKCGLCGHSLSCGWAHEKRRIYTCRGRLQLSNTDTSHKCSLKPIDADWLESAVWQKVSDALSDPPSLMRALDDYISKLNARSDELEKLIMPIDSQLAEISKKLARLPQDWVINAIGEETVNKNRAEFEDEEKRLLAIRQNIDPAQIEELENTKRWLLFWQKSKRELDLRLSLIAENAPDETNQRSHQASKVAAVLLGMADIDNDNLRDEIGSPTTKRQLFDYLQLEVIPFLDRIEIKASLPIKSIDMQDYNPDCMSARCRQSR